MKTSESGDLNEDFENGAWKNARVNSKNNLKWIHELWIHEFKIRKSWP